MEIAIIDYGAGNLFSVKNAIEKLGFKPVITNEKGVLLSADKVIFPGVGAFGSMMNSLTQLNLVSTIKEIINRGTPFGKYSVSTLNAELDKNKVLVRI